MADSGQILYEVRDNAAWLTIDHQDSANSLTKDMIFQLEAAWKRADQDPDVRVAVVTGAGERHFCSGGDRNQLASQALKKTPDEDYHFTSLQAGISKPVISAVNGAAAGAGMTVALDADIVLAVRTAKFLDPHTGIGLIVAGGPLAIARGVPFSEVARIGVAGMKLGAERAYQLGVVSELADDLDGLRNVANQYAAAVVRQSPTAVRVSLELMRRFRRDDQVRQILGDGMRAAEAQWNHPDAAEGPRAVLERRMPVWA